MSAPTSTVSTTTMSFRPSFVVKIVIAALLCTTRVFAAEDIVVSLSHGGRVRGNILTSEKHTPFYAFRGIPYGEPPIGDLRFKAPVPKAAWKIDSVLDATKDGPVCYQHDYYVRMQFVGEEDCLYLNVYTPQLPQNDAKNTNKSVMVFIHGGGFSLGDGTSFLYPPERLMDSDIVLVTINYRLDALGFLSTGDSSAPGNYGLLDQTLALQWVKDNIERFGGDAGSITIFGESAGGTSVSYHLISPLSKGLFHRAIAMSGSDLGPFALDPKPLFWAKHLASETKCPQNSTSALVECLRSKPVADLVLGIAHYMEFSSASVTFLPTVDGHFLPSPAKEILTYSPGQLNAVAVMSGTTEMEGSGVVNMMKQMKPNVSLISDEGFEYLFNNSMTNQDRNIIHMIKDRYLTSIDTTNEFEANRAVVKASSDGFFVMNHYEEVQLLSRAGLDVYVYSYDFATTNTFDVYATVDRSYGVGHGEDLYMLFNLTWLGGIRFEERDSKMVDIMTRVWTNFAKTGNPEPSPPSKWKPSSPDLFHIYHLNSSITVQDYDVNKDELFAFWTIDFAAARNQSGKQEDNKGTPPSNSSAAAVLDWWCLMFLGIFIVVRRSA